MTSVSVHQAYYDGGEGENSTCTAAAEDGEPAAADVDVFLLVYSVTDRQSFNYVQQCLQDGAKVRRRRRAGLVVVANKYDLVRNRVVTTAGSSALDFCTLRRRLQLRFFITIRRPFDCLSEVISQ